MDLADLRKQDFFESAVEFLNRKSTYRFWDRIRFQFSSLRTDRRVTRILESSILALRCAGEQRSGLHGSLHDIRAVARETRGPAQSLFE